MATLFAKNLNQDWFRKSLTEKFGNHWVGNGE